MNIFLSVIVGVSCSIIAGMMTPKIYIPSIIFGLIKVRNKRYKKDLENNVRYLLNYPNEEINIRISNNAALIMWLLMFAIGVLCIILDEEYGTPLTSFSRFIEYNMPAMILFIISFYFFGRVMKYSIILSEVDKHKREDMKNKDENIGLY